MYDAWYFERIFQCHIVNKNLTVTDYLSKVDWERVGGGFSNSYFSLETEKLFDQLDTNQNL